MDRYGVRALGVTALAGVMLAALTAGEEAAAQRAADAAPACDRDCIISVTDAYLAALVAGDPSAAPLADDVAFVENIARRQPGEGLWETAVSGPTDFAIHVPDTVQQSSGFIGMLQRSGEDGEPQDVLVAVHLKLEGGQIVQAEHMIAPITNPASLERLRTPRPGLVTEIPEGQRLPHADLVRIGLSYYDALQDNDGSLMPFAPECQRHENGMVTAGPEAGPGPNFDPDRAPVARDCAGQLDSGTFTYIARIEPRRLIAADPVTGLSMGLSQLRHPMDNLPYEVTHTDGTTSERNSENFSFAPFDMPAAHIFKIGADGLVYEIEALGFTAPYDSPTGWD